MRPLSLADGLKDHKYDRAAGAANHENSVPLPALIVRPFDRLLDILNRQTVTGDLLLGPEGPTQVDAHGYGNPGPRVIVSRYPSLVP